MNGKCEQGRRPKGLLPSGKRSPPMMRLATYPTYEELEMWRQMHQNPFFNRNRIVTENDVIEGLRYAKERTKLNAMPSAYLILKHQNIYKRKENLEKVKFKHTLDQMKHLPTKAKFHDKKCWAVSKEALFSPVRFQPFPVSSPKMLCYEAMEGPPKSRQLLRRPLAPVWRNSESVTGGSEMSLPLSNGQVDLEHWRKCSLTTVCKDDPLDPNNFYHKHYPLLLKCVPKRFKGEGGSDMYDEMYRPASKTPDIDMRFFYMLAHTALSDEDFYTVENNTS